MNSIQQTDCMPMVLRMPFEMTNMIVLKVTLKDLVCLSKVCRSFNRTIRLVLNQLPFFQKGSERSENSALPLLKILTKMESFAAINDPLASRTAGDLFALFKLMINQKNEKVVRAMVIDQRYDLAKLLLDGFSNERDKFCVLDQAMETLTYQLENIKNFAEYANSVQDERLAKQLWSIYYYMKNQITNSSSSYWG